MEVNLDSLSPNEFFGAVSNHSQKPNNGSASKSIGIGNIVTCLTIGGIVVYIFKDDIKALFNRLFGNNSEESS